MSALHKIFGATKEISRFCGKFIGSNVRSTQFTKTISPALPTTFVSQRHSIHTTCKTFNLMEFFDNKKNWGENEVKSGRSWTKDELRIKSNSDLHKLWFILLKERNMLMTMEHECNREMELFPSAERIDKVKISMENLETVVRERNRAYHLLETGVDGERPGRLVYNQLGIKFFYRSHEHVIPKLYNKKWNDRHIFRYTGMAVYKFQKLYREKLYNVKRKSRNTERNHVMHLLRRNPNLSKDLLRERYPSVDIDKLVRDDKVRGHFPFPE